MDNPLSIWYCDACSEEIKAVSDGYVIWKATDDYKPHSFKIIHSGRCDDDTHPLSNALEDFLGPDGLANLLSFLSLGPIKARAGQKSSGQPANFDEFVDFMRRVQTPYYEEARRLFSNPDLRDDYSDANEVLPYMQDSLQSMIKKYGEG